MELKVFGSSGGIESEERHSACYFLKGLNLFLDFGSGSFRAKEHLKGVDKISILLSHLHHDHIKGLPFLFEVFSGKEVDIYVPKGMKDDFYRYCEPPYWALPFTSFPFRINIMEMEDEFEIETLGGTVNVQTRSFEHPGGSTGFRISDGKKTLVYMTDVRSGGNGFGKAVDFARGADCLLHESMYGKMKKDRAMEEKHTASVEAAEVAKEAGVKMLLLCHIHSGEEMDRLEAEAKGVFRNSHAAREKSTYII